MADGAFERSFVPLTVQASGGGVEIEQDYHDGMEPSLVRVPLEQFDLFVGWLHEAKAACGAAREGGAW